MMSLGKNLKKSFLFVIYRNFNKEIILQIFLLRPWASMSRAKESMSSQLWS